MTNLTMGSLFAGVGGFDIAAERAGINVLWSSENDKHASTVLAEHFPNTPNYGDIHDIRIGRRKASAPKVDVLAGGFPCQSYSVAGNRGGLAEDRGALWWEFRRLISEGQPTWVVGENVPGLLSSGGGRDFTTIVKSLVQLGYGVVWRVLDAQYFGVAQRRRRVFIVGHSGGQPRPEVLALSEGLSGHPPSSRETRDVIAVHATQSPITGRDRAHALGSESQQAVLMRQREGKPGGGKGPLPSEDKSLTLAANTNDPTLFTGTQVRRLTPLECMRLQGFPDGWVDIPGNSDTQQYRQMGNAVAVPVAEWVLNRIAMVEAKDNQAKGDK